MEAVLLGAVQVGSGPGGGGSGGCGPGGGGWERSRWGGQNFALLFSSPDPLIVLCLSWSWSKPTLANPTLAIVIRQTLANPTLANPTLAKPTLANVKVLVVCKDLGFSELIVWVF